MCTSGGTSGGAGMLDVRFGAGMMDVHFCCMLDVRFGAGMFGCALLLAVCPDLEPKWLRMITQKDLTY